jgi:hypothetical protein
MAVWGPPGLSIIKDARTIEVSVSIYDNMVHYMDLYYMYQHILVIYQWYKLFNIKILYMVIRTFL